MALDEGESVGRQDQIIANTIQHHLAHPMNLTEYDIGFFGDSELAAVLATLKTLPNGHAKLHELKNAYGYFVETFNGTSTPEVTAADCRRTRPGGRPESLDDAAAASSSEDQANRATSQEQRWTELRERTKCVKCGRLGHWLGDPEC